MWNQSNYPPPNAGYGGGGPPGWAPSSGPPPPPGMAGGGYGGGYGAPPYGGGYNPGGAYNVNQYPQYGGGPYATGQHPPPGGQYGMMPGPSAPPSGPYQQHGGYGAGAGWGGYGGGYGGGNPAAVPGFTVPAAHQAQANYGGGQGPAPMQPPSSWHYNAAQNQMANMGMMDMQMRYFQQMGLIDGMTPEDRAAKAREEKRKAAADEDEDPEELKRQLQEEREKNAERMRKLQEKLENNDDMKNSMRENFITELMRRQEVNGTFEETAGTIQPLIKYDAEDPVAMWFQENKETDITGMEFDALYDAEYMRKAIKGFGTDEDAIIAIVTTRSNSQRVAILKEYKTAYGRDLKEDLAGDLSFNFKEIVLGLFESPARYDAWCVKKAIYDPPGHLAGIGTDEKTLIEILMTRTNAQLVEMEQEYDKITYAKQKDPGASLEKDIKGDTSGDFKRLLISAAQGNRRLIDREKLEEGVDEMRNEEGKWFGMFYVNYNKLCDERKVQMMANELFKAGEDRWGTDDETFNRIFSTQDYYTLRAVYDEYVRISQRDILNSVKRETSGDFKSGLKAIAQSVKCRPMFFAERLYKSMKGLGTDDSTLIRIIISRSEIDMVQIKKCFLERYEQTLWQFIKHDTSGHYKKTLQAIVGKN